MKLQKAQGLIIIRPEELMGRKHRKHKDSRVVLCLTISFLYSLYYLNALDILGVVLNPNSLESNKRL